MERKRNMISIREMLPKQELTTQCIAAHQNTNIYYSLKSNTKNKKCNLLCTEDMEVIIMYNHCLARRGLNINGEFPYALCYFRSFMVIGELHYGIV